MRIQMSANNGRGAKDTGKYDGRPECYGDTKPMPPGKYAQVWKTVRILSEKAEINQPALYINDSDKPRADAALFKGNGHMSFSKSMLEEGFKDKDIMIGVIGHEIGHIKLKHSQVGTAVRICEIVFSTATFMASTIGIFAKACLEPFRALMFQAPNVSGMANAMVAAGAGAVVSIAAGISSGYIAWTAWDFMGNYISRKCEISASKYTVRLTGDYKGLERGYMFVKDWGEETFDSKPWKERITEIGHYAGCESAVIRPKNWLEKAVAKIVYAFGDDHPALPKMLSSIEKEHAELSRSMRQGA